MIDLPDFNKLVEKLVTKILFPSSLPTVDTVPEFDHSTMYWSLENIQVIREDTIHWKIYTMSHHRRCTGLEILERDYKAKEREQRKEERVHIYSTEKSKDALQARSVSYRTDLYMVNHIQTFLDQ